MEPVDPPPRPLTVDEAVAFAIALQQSAQLDAAGELYRRILEDHPGHARALHYAGILAHQQQRHAEAIDLIERSLALVDDDADWHSNFGIALQTAERVDDAIAAYRRATVLDPGHANAHSNLGVLLRATGHPEEAEIQYRRALELHPEHIDAWTNLGILLNALDRTDEAAACYCRVITLRPRHREARKLLALAYATLGEVDEAVRVIREWLDEDPADPIAIHLLAACTGHDVPTRASDLFVERTFDSFAASFESKLQRLSYRAPSLVAAMLASMGVSAERSLDVLDAGCGTGLCGTLIAPYARTLTGIDLSAAMLAQAAEKHVYDELSKAELTGYLEAHPGSFDVIVSADTLVYFGDLRRVLDAMSKALRPGGAIAFTLEHAVTPPGADGYRLEMHGRYSHDRAYTEEVVRGVGLNIAIAEAQLRMEAGVPVAGLVVGATKPIRRDTPPSQAD